MVGLLGGGVWMVWPESVRPGVTLKNAARIKEGMMRAEVEAIMGKPAQRPNAQFQPANGQVLRDTTAWEWGSPAVFAGEPWVVVICDSESRVVVVSCPGMPQQESLLERFRRWLGL
jgi:hypothetical protein